VGTEQVGREFCVSAVDAYIGEEPARRVDLTGPRRDHRQLDPKALGRGPVEGVTTPPRQISEHRARGVASVADGDPCVNGPPGRSQPTILVTRAGRLLEHVVGQFGREVGASPSKCRSRVDEVCVHSWYSPDHSAFGTRRPHVTS
jgi:hypothetical protein